MNGSNILFRKRDMDWPICCGDGNGRGYHDDDDDG